MKLQIEDLRVESFATINRSRGIAPANWTRLPTCWPAYTCPECADT